MTIYKNNKRQNGDSEAGLEWVYRLPERISEEHKAYDKKSK